jgi:hypothetical protein
MLRSAGFMRSAAPGHAIALGATASILAVPPLPPVVALQARDQVRARWVVRTTLTSPAAVAAFNQ